MATPLLSGNPAVGEIYLRKSRALGDPDDPALLAHHRNALLRLAAADGVMIPSENILEEVVSGETIEKRPLFQQELARWEAGQARASVLYVVEISRLSRGSLAQATRIMEALRKARVRVRTPHRWYDLNAGDDNFIYGLLALLSHRENEIYKERVEIKRVDQVKKGLLLSGRPAWGYVWDRNRKGRGVVQIDPERFPILQAICREIHTESVHTLAARYGIPHATLSFTLRSPMICGWPARRHVADLKPDPKSSKRLPRGQWVWPEEPGDYPAACTRAEWEAIQAVLDARWTRKDKTGHDEAGWARDVLRFDQSPGRVRLNSLSRSRPLYERADPTTGHSWYVRREVVHAVVFAALARALAAPAALVAALKRRQEANAGDSADREGLRDRLAQLRERVDRLTEERAGLEDAEARASNRRVQDRLLQEVKRLTRELERAHAVPVENSQLDDLAAAIAAAPGGFPHVWERLTGPEKRALTNALVAAVPVRIVSVNGRQRYLREVGPVLYQPWVPELGD